MSAFGTVKEWREDGNEAVVTYEKEGLYVTRRVSAEEGRDDEAALPVRYDGVKGRWVRGSNEGDSLHGALLWEPEKSTEDMIKQTKGVFVHW